MPKNKQQRVPRTPVGNPLGGGVHIIGEGDVPKKVQDLIIAMFQEYVMPEFVKFNTVLDLLAGKMEKLESDRRFVISLDPKLMELIAIKLLGIGYEGVFKIDKTSDDKNEEEKKDGNV